MTPETRDYRTEFGQLLDEQYPITTNTTAEEDINKLLESGKRIPRYLAISHNDQALYYYLRHLRGGAGRAHRHGDRQEVAPAGDHHLGAGRLMGEAIHVSIEFGPCGNTLAQRVDDTAGLMNSCGLHLNSHNVWCLEGEGNWGLQDDDLQEAFVLLCENDVAWDAHQSGHYEYEPYSLIWRPGMDDPFEVAKDNDGYPVIRDYTLKALLSDYMTPELEELIDRYFGLDIEPLHEFIAQRVCDYDPGYALLGNLG